MLYLVTVTKQLFKYLTLFYIKFTCYKKLPGYMIFTTIFILNIQLCF